MHVVRLIVLLVIAGCARAGNPGAPTPATANLQGVWALYLEPVRASAEAEYATTVLRTALQKSGRFVLVEYRNEAHAVLRVDVVFQQAPIPVQLDSVRAPGRPGYQVPSGKISVLAVEAPHPVLWSRSYVAARARGAQASASHQQIVTTVVSQLERELSLAAGRPAR